jgi:hypothetical protein
LTFTAAASASTDQAGWSPGNGVLARDVVSLTPGPADGRLPRRAQSNVEQLAAPVGITPGAPVALPMIATVRSTLAGSGAAGAVQRVAAPEFGAGLAGEFGAVGGFERVDAAAGLFQLRDLGVDADAGGAQPLGEAGADELAVAVGWAWARERISARVSPRPRSSVMICTQRRAAAS